MKFTEFQRRYPNYSSQRFHSDGDGNVRFIFDGNDYDPFDIDGNLIKTEYNFPHYYGKIYPTQYIYTYLGIKAPTNEKDHNETTFPTQPKSGFPKALTISNKTYPIPAVAVDVNSNPHSIKILLNPLKIFVTPSESFTIQTKDIFMLTPQSVNYSSQYPAWAEEPQIKYWSQQLNFATWCATSGCGISYDLIEPDTQIGCILRFHVLYTIRSILRDLKVILPGEDNFKWYGSQYDRGAYNNLCTEFGVTKKDFRWMGFAPQDDIFNFHYTSMVSNSQTGFYTSSHRSRRQYDWFVPQKGQGLTKIGLSRLNQSIESYVYCILGSQVNTRSSIIGNSGSAIETQSVFLKLFESSVIERDISKNIQRYQFAIQEARVKLDLAISPGCWLLPSSLVINTDSKLGYNNQLQRATTEMNFGINPDINNETKYIGIPKNNMGGSKVKLPHHVNTHKQKPDDVENHKTDTSNNFNKPIIKPAKSSQTHDTNLAIITIGVAGLVWYMFR